jgi:hypothetical protein
MGQPLPPTHPPPQTTTGRRTFDDGKSHIAVTQPSHELLQPLPNVLGRLACRLNTTRTRLCVHGRAPRAQRRRHHGHRARRVAAGAGAAGRLEAAAALTEDLLAGRAVIGIHTGAFVLEDQLICRRVQASGGTFAHAAVLAGRVANACKGGPAVLNGGERPAGGTHGRGPRVRPPRTSTPPTVPWKALSPHVQQLGAWGSALTALAAPAQKPAAPAAKTYSSCRRRSCHSSRQTSSSRKRPFPAWCHC